MNAAALVRRFTFEDGSIVTSAYDPATRYVVERHPSGAMTLHRESPKPAGKAGRRDDKQRRRERRRAENRALEQEARRAPSL